MNIKPSIVIICLGNKYRGDDGAGLHVAEKIKTLNPAGIRIIDDIADGAAMIQAWTSVKKAIVVDCAHSGSEPGHIFRYDALREPIPETDFPAYSSHAIGIVDAIELARTLGELPESLIVYGIEGADFSPGEKLSPDVRRAAEEVVKLIISEIKGEGL